MAVPILNYSRKRYAGMRLLKSVAGLVLLHQKIMGK
jgi:hypothetical protein